MLPVRSEKVRSGTANGGRILNGKKLETLSYVKGVLGWAFALRGPSSGEMMHCGKYCFAEKLMRLKQKVFVEVKAFNKTNLSCISES